MITLLRKLFIKNYKDVTNKEVRKKHGILAAVGGIFINLLLFGIKLLIGILSFSMSIISDAINNLSDMFSCFVTLIGFIFASKKADSKHPYGHERIEYIAGMIVSFLIICVAVLLGYNSIMTLISGTSETNYNIYAFIILGVSILGKILLGLYYRGIGKVINSVSLKASMQDSFNDCISTGVVLIAALIQYFFPSLWWIDAGMSIAVAVFILYSGIKMVSETASPLVGMSPDSEFVKQILDDVKSYDVVLGVHDIVCHSYGPTKVFITLHCEVDGYKDMFIAHDCIDEIEAKLNRKYGIELTIHMDPIDTKNKELPIIKEELTRVLNEYDSDITFHDLRMTSGPTHCNILFDVVVPMGDKVDEKELIHLLRESLIKLNSKYNAVIKIDYDYTGK